MSRLLLVRHGQASFHGDDYDRLSPTGHDQARQLGLWMVRNGVRPDAVYVGTRRRQQETLQGLQAAFAEAGAPLPASRTMPELDEVKFEAIVRHFVKERNAEDAELQALGRAFVSEADPELKPRAFVRLAQAVCGLWLGEQESIPGAERWHDFRSRAVEGFAKIRREQRRGKTVLAVTSAGPISAFLQEALGCPPQTALALWWTLANASLTEFLYSETRLTLTTFNSLPHLPDPRAWTYL